MVRFGGIQVLDLSALADCLPLSGAHRVRELWSLFYNLARCPVLNGTENNGVISFQKMCLVSLLAP